MLDELKGAKTVKPTRWGNWRRTFRSHRESPALILAVFCAFSSSSSAAAIPGAEKLLPEDTLLVVSAPDVQKLGEIYRTSAAARFVNDPAMRPFTEKFISQWKEEFVEPLARELNLNLESYASLLRGQVTLALTQNGWHGKDDQAPGLLVLLDTRDKSAQLKTNLADFRQKWADAGKAVRLENIRGLEFLVLPFSSNDVPKTLRKFLPQPAEVQELGAETKPAKTGTESELVLGSAGSLLILGNSIRMVEKVVVQLTGGSAPALGELGAFRACQLNLFRNAPLYVWVNAKPLLEILARRSERKENPQAPNPFDPHIDRLIATSGLTGLKSVALSFENENDGCSFRLFLGLPEEGRQGIFKVITGEPKESSPPAFVPADAVKFQRWRLNTPKAWNALETMRGDVAWINTLGFILEAANANARLKDPSLDIKPALLGNLGNDIITYEKAAHGNSAADRENPPAIMLVGCQRADQVSAALKSVFGLLNQGASATEREFLGRKIFSVPLPQLPLPMAETSRPQIPRALNYSVSGGYAAFSTSAALIEEYLRSGGNQSRTLREAPGLLEAAEKVSDPGTGLFGYENQVEAMRATFESLKAPPAAPTPGNPSNPITGAIGLSSPEASVKDWMDFSLLPAFDRVSKYFYFTVYAGSASTEGLTFRMFAPVPPQSRAAPREWADTKAASK